MNRKISFVTIVLTMLAAMIFVVPASAATEEIHASDSRVTFVGDGWRTGNANRVNGSLSKDPRQTGTAGDYVEIEFEGTGVQYLARKAEGAADMDFFLDGKLMTRVVGYVTPAIDGTLIFEADGLAPGKHTLKMVNTGVKDPTLSNQDKNVFYDVVVVTKASGAAPSTAAPTAPAKPAPAATTNAANPTTGDAGVTLSLAMFLAAASVLAVVTSRRNRNMTE